MKRSFIILLFCILYCCISYGAEEGKEIKGHPTPEEIQKAQQHSQQQQRPILPPVVPAFTSMVSPTPSPQIAAPQITPQFISQPSHIQQNVPTAPIMRNIPSVPAYIASPNVPVPIDIPNISMIGNTIGKVVKLGSEKDGSLFIDVDDELFGETIRVKIKNLKNTPIVRQASIYDFNQIKIGDTVNAMYHTEDEDNVANFISVLTEEEIEMRKQYPAQEPTLTPKEDTTQPQNQ